MKPQMLIPEFFRPAMDEATKIIKKTPKKQDDDVLLDLAQSDGWEKLKAIIDGKCANIQDMTTKATRKCSTLEEVGFRYAIMDQTVAALQSIVDVVELRIKVKRINDAKLAGK